MINTLIHCLIKEKYYHLKGIIEDEVPGKFDLKDRYARLGSAVHFWNVFQHFYPYFNEV